MRMTIAERLHPFSHTPGVYSILPGTAYEIQFFPARLIIRDLSTANAKIIDEIEINIQGPVEKFTLTQDLERGELRVYGDSATGYFRYSLFALPAPSVAGKSIGIFIEKSPQNGLEFSPSQYTQILSSKEGLAKVSLPRLSLGNHKAQDWDLVTRRGEMEEIFPAWHHLALLTKEVNKISYPLLDQCQEVIGQRTPEKILPAFKSLFKVGFRGILSPTLKDQNHQGFALPEILEGSPLYLLKKGGELIQSLFVQSPSANEFSILPALPPEFHCGRFLNVPCADLGSLDLEWSKKTIRRLFFHASSSGTIDLVFQKGIKCFRLRTSEADRGQVIQVGTPIKVESSHHYFFDNFQC